MNLGRVGVVAANVFREVIRDRVLYLIAFFAVLLMASAALIPYIAAATEDKIIADVGLAAISILGLIITIFVGTNLINKEIEKRTVYVLIAKPISHVEFIVGKHLGLSSVLAVLVLAMMAIYMAVLSYSSIPFSWGSLLLTGVFQFLELSLITAVALLFGVFTSSLLATLFTFAVYLMGHFSRDLLAFGNLAKDDTVSRITQGLYLVLPDLARLNLKNQAVYGMELLPTPVEMVSNGIYALIYIALLLAIATFIFSRRQF